MDGGNAFISQEEYLCLWEVMWVPQEYKPHVWDKGWWSWWSMRGGRREETRFQTPVFSITQIPSPTYSQRFWQPPNSLLSPTLSVVAEFRARFQEQISNGENLQCCEIDIGPQFSPPEMEQQRSKVFVKMDKEGRGLETCNFCSLIWASNLQKKNNLWGAPLWIGWFQAWPENQAHKQLAIWVMVQS